MAEYYHKETLLNFLRYGVPSNCMMTPPHIERMLDCIPAVDMKPVWTDVNTQPPQIHPEGILVCDVHGNIMLTRQLITLGTEGNQFYLDDSYSNAFFDRIAGKEDEIDVLIYENRITHWMPLPKPPKQNVPA